MTLIPSYRTALLAAALAAPLLTTPSGWANLIISTQDDAPTENLALAQSESNSSYRIKYSSSSEHRDVGETFRLDRAIKLDKIVIRQTPDYAPGSGFAGAAVTLDIVRIANEYQEVAPTQVVSSQTATLPTSIGQGDYLVFDLDDVDLPVLPLVNNNPAVGEHYGFILRFNENAAGRYTNLAATTTNVIANGSLFELNYSSDGTQTYARHGSNDLEFYVVQVPEPGSMALFMLGGLLLARRRRCTALR